MAFLFRRSVNQSLLKALAILIVMTLIVCIHLEFESTKLLIYKSDVETNARRRSHQLRHNNFNLFNSFHNTSRRRKKIFLAFFYWEQLTMSTNNLLHLTALGAYGRRQVVVPFVKDSQFRGVPTSEGYEKLARYFNVSALNYTLRSYGHATLINWEEFQDVCKGRLDVVVHFDYKDLKNTTTFSRAKPYVPCKQHRESEFHGIQIKRRICVNVFALDSVERFENEVVKKLPCVGIFEWRGTSKTNLDRTQFNITSVVGNVLSYRDISAFFSSNLLHIAYDFIAKNLDPNFIAVHIRTEQILKTGRNISTLEKCLSNLKTRVQDIRHANTGPIHVFMATDFTEFGSSSKIGKPARKNAKSLMEILVPLKPIIFQPSEYKLADRGEVAIVEMNVLASGKHLVVLGGGSFQYWIETQFLNKNNNDQTRVEHLSC